MEHDYLNLNQKLWNDKTEIHYKSDFYDVNSFLKGKSSLKDIEIALLGDVKGKKILHLQCHFGMDTISLAKMGADCTGVDFSEKAIIKARELNQQIGADAKFIHCDVYSLTTILSEEFDIVFTSYGVLGWLPDMKKWAETVSHFLKPNGQLVLVEFHPVVWMFSYDFKRIEFNYQNSGPIVEELEGTYAEKDAALKNKSISWNHGLAEVIQSILSADLNLKSFKEYNFSPYNCFEKTIKQGEDNYQISGLENKIPLTYSIKAEKI